MPYDGLIAELPAGIAGMVNHDNRLRSGPTELFTAEGVLFEDDHIQKAQGATLYDATGIGTTAAFFGTASTTGQAFTGWIAGAATFRGSYTLPGTLVISTPGPQEFVNTQTQTFSAGAAIGELVVVAIALQQPADIAPAEPVITLTDGAANTWTKAAQLTRTHNPNLDISGSTTLAIFFTIVTSTISGSITNLTVQTRVRRDPVFSAGIIAHSYAGPATPVLDRTRMATGFDDDPATIWTTGSVGTLSEVPELTFGAAFVAPEPVNHDVTIVPNVSFTNQSEVYVFPDRHTATGAKLRVGERLETTEARLTGLANFFADQQEASVPGTVTTTAGGKDVVGVGTTFTNFAPGDSLVIGGERRVIESITDATNLVVSEAYFTANAAVAYTVETGPRFITSSTDGTIYEEKPTSLTTGNLDEVSLFASLTPTLIPPFFVQGGREAAANLRHLFIFTGHDAVQVVDGNTGTSGSIATPPADWAAGTNPFQQPIGGTIHRNRLVGFGNLNDPHRLYISDPDDHENFTGAAATTIRIRSDIGERIYAGTSFNGVLYVFKWPVGVFWLDDSDLDPSFWEILVKSQSLGCAPSPYAVLPIDDDLLMMAADGSVHLVSAVDALGGVSASNLTKRLGLNKFIRDNVNVGKLERMRSVYDHHAKEAVFYVPSTGATTPDLALKFNFGLVGEGGPVRFGFDRRDSVSGAVLRGKNDGGRPDLAFAEQDTVYLITSGRNKDDAPYTMRYETPELDMSHVEPSLRTLRKNWDFLELIFAPDSTGTVDVNVKVDGVSQQQLQFDATKRRDRKRLNCGGGHTISIVGQNTEANQNPQILGMLIWFQPSNEDQR